jgi:16S rRNA (guanine(966)-N(2))-methyltransferase RsmD
MRIITGKYKKATLYSVPGNTARSTTDYVKELVFSILEDMEDMKVLDLFAGSGNLGLEALSRGARFVDFVEFSQKSIVTIFKNIEKLHCGDLCHVHRKKVSTFLKKSPGQYDYIFLDPPYEKNLINETIQMILENNFLQKNGMIVVEHATSELIDLRWKELIVTEKKSGNTRITILRREDENL